MAVQFDVAETFAPDATTKVKQLNNIMETKIIDPLMEVLGLSKGTPYTGRQFAKISGGRLSDLPADGAIANAHLRESVAYSVIGNSLGATGSPADIQAGANGHYLKRAADQVLFGVISADDLPSSINAAKIGAGSVSNTEFGYLDGVTSAIQTQLDAKATKTPQFLTLAATSDLTNERYVAVADGVKLTDAGAGSTATFGYAPYYAMIYSDSNQSINTGDYTHLTLHHASVDSWGTVVDYTTNYCLTVPSDGMYIVNAVATFGDTSSTGQRRLMVYADGSELWRTADKAIGSAKQVHLMYVGFFGQGQVLKLYANQDSGSSVNITYAELGIVRLGGQR